MDNPTPTQSDHTPGFLPEENVPPVTPKQHKFSRLREVVLSLLACLLVFGGLWYATSIMCATDDSATFKRCETIRVSIISVTTIGLFVYRLRTMKLKGETLDASAGPSTPPVLDKSAHTKGFLFCIIPFVLILPSLANNSSSPLLNLICVGLGFIGYITLIPSFVYGVVLMQRSRR